tara:strand:- start:1529 stop:3202 length:1674 start_codon:yes stop_codon:yes gene_type:complete
MSRRNNRDKSPSRDNDPIIAQHSHFFSPRINKPGYYIFINPHLDNSVSNKICRSITDNIVPNYDIQQVWMHPQDTVTQWGLRNIAPQKDGNKTHWIHQSGTYFSKYDDMRGSATLFSSVINRLRFENYISWGAEDDTEYYACGEYLNAAFFEHNNARRDCAFVMLHYTINNNAIKERYDRFINLVSDAIENNEETYIEKFITEPDKWKFLLNTTTGRRKSSLRDTFPQDAVFGNMINGGFLYVRDLNYSDNVDYLYIEGICASKYAGKSKRRGNDKTLFKNGEKKIIVPHSRTGKKEASPGLEFVDMTNIISYMSGYRGTKLSALIHVINFYFTKFNFKFLQQSLHDHKFKNPQPYPDQQQSYVDKLVAGLSKAKQDQAKSLEYQELFNFEGILKDSAHAHTWPERYHEDWRRRIDRAKSKGLAITPILEREYERYESHRIGDDGFNQYFIWDSFNLPVLPEQRLTQVTASIMADASPRKYGYLLQAPPKQQQPRESVCQKGMSWVNDRCVAFGGRRTKRKKKRRKNNKKRTKKRGRRRKRRKRTRKKRKKKRKTRK